jgi:ribosomal protein L11 methylase PrmA
MLPTIVESLTEDGEAVLSGILVEERAAMLDVLGAGGWEVLGDDVEGMWWSARIARR